MDFFGFYTLEQPATHPFMMFSIAHIACLTIVFIYVLLGMNFTKNIPHQNYRKFEITISLILVCCEFIYYIWNILCCPNPPLTEILPLHLCSICIWTSFIAIWFDLPKLRSFVAVNNVLAALIALFYPATIASINQLLSYRSIYFFISHGTILLLGCLQLRNIQSLSYKDIPLNIILVSIFAGLAMIANFFLQSNYLFVGFPSSIPIIETIHQTVGNILYFPCAVIVLTILEVISLSILKLSVDKIKTHA